MGRILAPASTCEDGGMSDASSPATSPAAAPTSSAYAGRTEGRVAVVTGASSGIGAATVRALAAAGFRVVCAARRADRIEALAAEVGGLAMRCDVTDRASVAGLARAASDLGGGAVHVLVNNAGGAFGSDPIESADPEQWRAMYEVNVIGTLHVTQAVLPLLRAGGDGLVVNVGSTAGRIAYEGGAGYTAAKHGTQVVTETLRLELCGEPVRVTEIAPGMVRTEEFSLVRFGGDRAAAARVYEGVPDPLVAEDVADAVAWVATRPAHVNIDEMVIRPRAQAAQHKVHRLPRTS
jgi:NADP-dependent 3-hydroxy acid dehydrogenase YdfG